MILSDEIPYGSLQHKQILELIVDPQTCGPLVLACSSKVAIDLLDNGPWKKIGSVDSI